MKRKTKISYHNDVFFQYALTGNDDTSKFIRKRIIELVTGIRPKKTTVKNPIIHPADCIGKSVILDVLMSDEHDVLYDIEMQMSGYTDSEQLRFQKYGVSLANKQLKKGEKYTDMKKSIQIIFIDDEPVYPDTGLIDHLMFRDAKGRAHPSGSIISIYFVHMKLIDKIVKEKGFAALSELEQLCYLFKNGTKGGILKVRKRLVKAFMEKYKHMEQEQEWWTLADAIERGEQAKNAIIEERYQKGKKQGIEIGKEQGIEEGKKLNQQKMLKSMIELKFQIDASDWIKTLDNEKMERAVLLLLNCDSFDDLKQRIALEG